MDLQELRDLIIVIFGIGGIVVLLVTLVVVLVVGLSARGLIGTIRGILREQVTPAMDSARQVADDVRGTTSFITDAAVSPIIRLYGLFAGLRRAFASLLGLTQLGRRKGR
jgi:hypothetical protein